jgi:hypothetical protein
MGVMVDISAQERDSRLVAEFCAALPEMRRAADSEGWSGLLDATNEELRLRAAPPGDVLDRLWEYLGLRGVTRRGARVPIAVAGQDPVPPPEGSYRCPGPHPDRCSRCEQREPSGPVPECALHGLPMRFVT